MPAAAVAAAAKSLQSCPTLCDPIDGSPPGSSIHGIFQAKVLEWAAIAAAKSPESCPTLCDPIDGSPLETTDAGLFCSCSVAKSRPALCDPHVKRDRENL